MDLPKLVDNRKKACFLGKGHSLEATCSVLSFISSYPATRRHRTEQYKIYSNRIPTAHELTHQHSEFDVTSIHTYTYEQGRHGIP